MADLRDMVLSRVDIADLIGQYVALTAAGREWKGRCPFHEEKTASFHVNVDKGLFHCFGCKAGGNVVDFVMRIENLEFRDALEWLANRYNIEIPEYKGSGTRRGEKERLYDLNEAALKFFRASLKNPEAEQARQYLESRGVTNAMASEFDLGYAPREWQALGDLLMSKGASSADLLKLGLIKERRGDTGGGEGRKHYDAFRHRLIFPIRAVTGRVIAFAGRALSAEDTPKYLNVTNTPLYNKSETLYNLDRAKGQIRDEGAVVVEGYMDVIGLSSAGVNNTVATCGTALTAEHVKLMKRYGDKFYIAFDGDEAGRKAAWGSSVLFLKEGLQLGILPLPAGKDPDDFARKEGSEGWAKLLSQAKGAAKFWLDHQLEASPDPPMTTQRQWVSQLAPLYRQLPDELSRQQFRQQVASALRLGAYEVAGLLGSTAKPGGTDPKHRLKEELRQRSLLQGAEPIEREALRRLAIDDEFLFAFKALAEPGWFANQQYREACQALFDAEDKELVVKGEQHARLFSSVLAGENSMDTNDHLLLRLSNFHLERQMAVLQSEWQEANREKRQKDEDRLLGEILKIKSQIKRIKSMGSNGL